MAVICGAVGAAIDPGRTGILDPVIATLAMHGIETSMRTATVGRRTCVVAARHSGPIDPGFASEPTSDDRNAITVVADVRLDHRGKLVAALGASTSLTDPELVLAAYLRWQDQCIDRLYGDFAFAIVDPRRGGVLLARDHAGHRPLVVHERPGVLAFSSTALALTGFDGVGHRLDTERAAEVMALGYGTDRTFVEGVRMVHPGTALWADDHGVRRWRWWDAGKIEVHDLGSLAAHAAALRGALDESVASQLPTSGRAAIMLSGGLDSTAVAATAAPLVAPDELLSYTSVPPRGWVGPPDPGRDPDERHLVEALADRYHNLSPKFIEVSGRHVFEHHETLWELGAGPIRNALNAMWVLAINEEAAADGVTALLTGASGNQAFSADGPRWLVDLVQRGHPVQAVRELQAWAQARGDSQWSTARSQLLRPIAPRWLRTAKRRRRGGADRLDDWITATAIRPDRVAELDLPALVPGLGEVDTTRWTRQGAARFMTSSSQAEHHTATRTWWGIENRDPTSERRLLEVALAQPERWRRHQGVDRAILRAAMAGRMPSEIVDRTRRGAQLPDWYDRLLAVRHDIEAEVEELRDHPASRDVVDVDRLTSLVRAWPSRDDSFTVDVLRDYRLAMPRALLVSRYLRWFEGRARRVAAGGPAVVVPPR